jgi:hypothetical protein
MKAVVFSVFAILSFITMPALAVSPDKNLLVAVEQLSTLLSDGYAELYTEPLIPIRSSSTPTVAVFFTLEGPGKGNGSWQFLAFFEHNQAVAPDEPPSHSYRLVAFRQVGSRETRFFEAATASFHNGSLTVSGRSIGPDDPMCCPSVPIRALFKIQNGIIVEQPAGRCLCIEINLATQRTFHLLPKSPAQPDGRAVFC